MDGWMAWMDGWMDSCKRPAVVVVTGASSVVIKHIEI